MKKILGLGIIFLLLSGFCTSSSSNAKTEDIDFLLLPYQKVMDKLTKELGVPFYVENKNKERFYNNIKDMTPKEFEKLVRDEYKESEKDINESKSYNVDDAPAGGTSGPSFIPNHDGPVNTTPLN